MVHFGWLAGGRSQLERTERDIDAKHASILAMYRKERK